MALASFKSAKSVVGLSESPVYHYQYSSITDAISNLARTSAERDERRKSLQRLFLEHFASTKLLKNLISLGFEYYSRIKNLDAFAIHYGFTFLVTNIFLSYNFGMQLVRNFD
jgi:hypothetical protein